MVRLKMHQRKRSDHTTLVLALLDLWFMEMLPTKIGQFYGQRSNYKLTQNAQQKSKIHSMHTYRLHWIT